MNEIKKVSTKNHLEQKERLLDTARELFATKGYEATTTRKIKEASHTSEGLLYYYFPGGKKELFDAVVLDKSWDREAVIEAFQFQPVATLAQLKAEIMRFFKAVWENLIQHDNYQIFMITVHEQAVINDGQDEWITRLNHLIVGRLTKYLRDNNDFLQNKLSDLVLMSKTLVANLQALIFSDLVIKGNRQISSHQFEALEQQVNFILQHDI